MDGYKCSIHGSLRDALEEALLTDYGVPWLRDEKGPNSKIMTLGCWLFHRAQLHPPIDTAHYETWYHRGRGRYERVVAVDSLGKVKVLLKVDPRDWVRRFFDELGKDV